MGYIAGVAGVAGTGGGGGGSSDAQRFDAQTFDGSGGAGGGGDGGPGDDGGGGGGGSEEHLRLSYVKEIQFRDGETPPQVDLWIYDFQDQESFNVTGGDPEGVNCKVRQCELNGDMTWVAWLETGMGGGFNLYAAPVDVTRKLVKTEEKRLVSDQVNSFSFTSDLLVYTKGQSVGNAADIEVWVEPAGGADEAACGMDKTRCKTMVPQRINGNGGFRVTGFSDLIILITTTLSSMTIGFYNIATEQIFTLYTFGEEEGTGSEFSGRQPMGLSPDATYMAVFTRNDQAWVLNTLIAGPNPTDPERHDLWATRNAQMGECEREEPYNFNEVSFDPVFGPEGSHIYFLAKGDCTRQAGGSNRDDSDIVRLPRNLSGELENVTNNPRASHWSNQEIGDFDLDSTGEKLAFTAPRPMDAQSRSVWLMDVDSGEFDCSRGAEQAGIDGKTRCEFLFDETANAQITYRDLKFHDVVVGN